MQTPEGLSERQFRVLAAVIQIYVETAEPAGSQSVAHRSRLGISPASIRSTMSELEAMGVLFHAHTSGGRIPTDRGYRVYVNQLFPVAAVPESTRARLESEIAPAGRSAIDEILRRAAQILGVLTQELGVAIAPALDGLALERLELVRVSSERLLAVLTLQSGLVRTIFVEIPAAVAADAVDSVSRVPHERPPRPPPSGSPGEPPRAAPRCRRARREPRSAQHLRGPGRRALRPHRRRGHGGAGKRAAARGAARVRLQHPDAPPPRPHRAARSPPAGVRGAPPEGAPAHHRNREHRSPAR